MGYGWHDQRFKGLYSVKGKLLKVTFNQLSTRLSEVDLVKEYLIIIIIIVIIINYMTGCGRSIAPRLST